MNIPSVVAIIPARGGSKGIPRKNLALVGGVPLVARTVVAARQAAYVERTIVSTDDEEIGAVAEAAGAEVIKRPADLAQDESSSELSLLHALQFIEKEDGVVPELTLLAQCTSPLTSSSDIDEAIRKLVDSDADSCFSATRFEHFVWCFDQDGMAHGINHDPSVRQRRQDRELQVKENGAIYVMRTTGLRKSGHRFFGKIVAHLMARETGFEIDEPVDLVIADGLVRYREGHARRVSLPDLIDAVVLDFDGVMTDNRVLVFQDGTEAVLCSRSDGWGLAKLLDLGMPIFVLSAETNTVVGARCDKLGIPCIQDVKDKRSKLSEWLGQNDLSLSRTIFVGNDVNDIECMRDVGCAVAVGDAHPDTKAIADLILTAPGGHGAVRELTELIINHIKKEIV